MSQKTGMSKQVTVGISTICQESSLFPALKAAECSATVPRIGGMKISLFIMGANQISDATLPSSRGGAGGRATRTVTNTLLQPHHHPTLSYPHKAVYIVYHIYLSVKKQVDTGNTLKRQLTHYTNFCLKTHVGNKQHKNEVGEL